MATDPLSTALDTVAAMHHRYTEGMDIEFDVDYLSLVFWGKAGGEGKPPQALSEALYRKLLSPK